MEKKAGTNPTKVLLARFHPIEIFTNLFKKWPRLTVSVLITSVTLSVFFPLYFMVPKIIESAALQDAELFVKALREFRTLYTSEVIKTIENHGEIEISHDYKDKEHAIPLPATLSMLIGERIGKTGKGGTAKLYSKYPFPWRVKNGGLKDNFSREAWEILSKDPQKVFYRVISKDGQDFLRYAAADVMRTGCINCHNNHPQSPKQDWKVGNVRGVIEVGRPITPVFSSTLDQLTPVISIPFLLIILVFLPLTKILMQFQSTTEKLEIRTDAYLLKTQDLSKANRKLREAQIQLIEAEKMGALGQLSGIVAHELRNPLNAMKSSVYYLNSKLEKGEDKLQKHLGIIQRGIDNSDRIISDVLGFAKVRRPEYNNADINDKVRGALTDSQVPKGVNIHLDFDQEIPELPLDTAQLHQVFINIITNAVQAMQGQGELRIQTRLKGKQLVVSFSDDGPGMDEETQGKIFEPLFTTKTKGTGLGLAVCKSLVQGQGGLLQVKSSRGHGTTFSVLLPLKRTMEDKEING